MPPVANSPSPLPSDDLRLSPAVDALLDTIRQGAEYHARSSAPESMTPVRITRAADPATPIKEQTPSKSAADPTPETLCSYFRSRTADLSDPIFQTAHNVAQPGTRLSHGASATPRIRADFPAPRRDDLTTHRGRPSRSSRASRASRVAHTPSTRRRRARPDDAQDARLLYNAERYAAEIACVGYQTETHGFVELEGESAHVFQCSDGGGGADASAAADARRTRYWTSEVVLGPRAARVPLPYAVCLQVPGNGVGRARMRRVADESRGAFVRVEPLEVDLEEFRGREFAEANFLFWAAPVEPNTEASIHLELDVDGAVLTMVVTMRGVHAEFSVRDGSAGVQPMLCSPTRWQGTRPAAQDTTTCVQFCVENGPQAREMIVQNNTAENAPLLITVSVPDDAGGCFSIGLPNQESQESIVQLLEGRSSFSFTVRCQGSRLGAALPEEASVKGADDTVDVDPFPLLGHASVRLPLFVPSRGSRSVDRDLFHYYDHVIDLSCGLDVAQARDGACSPALDDASAEEMFSGLREYGEMDDETYEEDYRDDDNDKCRDLKGILSLQGADDLDKHSLQSASSASQHHPHDLQAESLHSVERPRLRFSRSIVHGGGVVIDEDRAWSRLAMCNTSGVPVLLRVRIPREVKDKILFSISHRSGAVLEPNKVGYITLRRANGEAVQFDMSVFCKFQENVQAWCVRTKYRIPVVVHDAVV